MRNVILKSICFVVNLLHGLDCWSAIVVAAVAAVQEADDDFVLDAVVVWDDCLVEIVADGDCSVVVIEPAVDHRYTNLRILLPLAEIHRLMLRPPLRVSRLRCLIF